MPVKFIGFVGTREESEIIPPTGPLMNMNYIETLSKVQENAGFDRVLLAVHASRVESILVAQHVAAVAPKLGLMIAHRPGFTAPTVAARQFATLDHITKGRVAVHIIAGASDAEMATDGDYLTKEERYARASEYLDIMRAEWSRDAPFDYKGRYYKVDKGFSAIHPYDSRSLPIYFGGASSAALEVAGKHADTYAVWGESLAGVANIVKQVREQAAKHGRKISFSLSLRPIIAGSEEAAWNRAKEVLELTKQRFNIDHLSPSTKLASDGFKRLVDLAKQGGRLDKCLWTELAAVTPVKANSTGLVGTPEQVADAMMEYHAIGIETFLIRGFDPISDAARYGRELIPLVRSMVSQREHGEIVDAARVA